MTPKLVSPQEAKNLIQQGAVLIDIREKTEYFHEHISFARPLSLTDIKAGQTIEGAELYPVIFHCQSGIRTVENSNTFMKSTRSTQILLMEGGINAWKRAGLPTVKGKNQPISIMRQVQIVAGTLIITGVTLGYTVNSWLFLLSGFVGAGLLFAGFSAKCGMASFLLKMPWNRPEK